MAARFLQELGIAYNLACYYAQLGEIGEAQDWFMVAMALDEQNVKGMAIDDPDLEPLWRPAGVVKFRP